MSVDRVVGSHWFQQLFHKSAATGRYVRLPQVYHVTERRWIHINGAFLGPSQPAFFARFAYWNASCLYCHNTRVAGNPYPIPGDDVPGYRTTVGELGISCEACHGAAERHVRLHQNPARRLAQIASAEPDPDVVNPARLPVPRADEVCGRCHGAPVIRPKAWDRKTLADPFLPGAELDRYWRTCWSQREMDDFMAAEKIDRGVRRQNPAAIDGRFWGDGTPLTTALEYQGVALSACYENGRGRLSCMTCHTMHGADPNHQLRVGMRTNESCLACHEGYRSRVAEHTHHAPGSAGSECMNCHMPHQVYSLLDTHRTHRIGVPRVRDSVGTGKPHACNLCHLDKTLGWTSDHLRRWYGTAPERLSEEERTVASGLLLLARGDARSRAVVAAAFRSPAAHAAAGRDWPGPLLTTALRHERYEAVRYLMHRSLRALLGPAADGYNYQGTPAERATQVDAIEARLGPRPDPRRYPALMLTDDGRLADVVTRWLETRSDPDVSVDE